MTRRESYRLAQRTALISGALAVIVAALLLADYGTRVAEDPLNSPEFVALKKQLLADPQNAELQQSLRALDKRLREAYFDRRHFAAWGTWLLLGSCALCVASVKWSATLRRRLPSPQPALEREDPVTREQQLARWSVTVAAGIAVILAISLYAGIRSSLPEPEMLAAAGQDQPANPAADGLGTAVERVDAATVGAAQPHAEVQTPEGGPTAKPETPAPSGKPAAGGAVAATDGAGKPAAGGSGRPVVAGDLPELPAGYPTDAEIAENWPRFRGPGGLGVCSADDVPTAWDGESGEGVLWKTEVPLAGNNSPVVWGDRVFVTGADETQREVYCFDAHSGTLLWRQPLPAVDSTPSEVPKVMEATGLAAPTAATDGRRVYAVFANGEIGAFDFEGRLRWQRSLGLPKNAYGHASSLAVHQGLVLVQFDQGTRAEKLSKLIALEAASGQTVWEAAREVPNSWPSPIVIQVDGQPQIITCADPWVIAYSPADGAELWRAECLQGDVGPSPVVAGGMVFAANEFPGVTAVRVDGSGDVTSSHIAWEADLGAPDCCSPVATEELVFLAASYGILTCYDAKQGGDPLWEQEFEDASFVSSPTLIGKYLYLFDEEGRTWVVQPDRQQCPTVAENALGERCVTSPAVREGKIYIRGEKHLFCIGAK